MAVSGGVPPVAPCYGRAHTNQTSRWRKAELISFAGPRVATGDETNDERPAKGVATRVGRRDVGAGVGRTVPTLKVPAGEVPAILPSPPNQTARPLAVEFVGDYSHHEHGTVAPILDKFAAPLRSIVWLPIFCPTWLA
jgi:hypothetical protein